MLAVIGFLALFLGGLYLSYAGFMGAYIAFMFTGELTTSVPAFIMGCIGAGLIYLACVNAPFAIVVA